MARPSTAVVHNAKQTANGVLGLMIIGGTLGTADTTDSQELIRASGNPLTGASYVEVIGGVTVTGGSNVNIISGTVGTIANIGVLHNGTVVVSSVPQISIGTIPQISVGTLPTVNLSDYGTNINVVTGSQQTLGTVGTVIGVGTITGIPQISVGTLPTVNLSDYGTNIQIINGTVTRISNIGTLELGSIVITSIPQISVGTIPNLNIATGTQQTLGTVGTTIGVGVVSNLTNGSVNILSGSISGTVLGGTIQNLATGTITSVAELVKGTITQVTTVSNLTNGSVNILTGTIQSSGTTTGVGVVSNLTNGSVNILTGTVTSITNLAGGTTQISKTPVQVGTPYHVRGTTGAAVWGTIIAASGAGTKQYVSHVSTVVVSGTVDVAITNIGVGGSTGAGVFVRGQFVPSAGISKDYDPVIPSGTNGTIAYWMGGAGTVDFMINYWQAT